MNHLVSLLAKPTEGDKDFVQRWMRHFPTVQRLSFKTSILAVDQYTEVTDELIDKLPELRYVCSATTGHTHLKFTPNKRGIRTITLRGETEFLSTITSVGEYTIYLLHKLARFALKHPTKLFNKDVAIIGYGRVGKYVGSICRAMGMKVKTFDKGNNRHYLKSLFRDSDVISIHLSENDSTKGMISKELIALVKPTCLFINTARASIVDEKALFEAVLKDKIGGVGTDVLGVNSPLKIDHKKIIHSPHIAGRCLEDRIATDEFILNKLLTTINGINIISR